MSSNRHLTVLTGIALLGAALAIAAWPDEDGGQETRAQARPVEVAEVAAVDAQRVVSLAGVARSADRARLAFSVPGRIATRRVEAGDRVQRGQTLAQLDDREFRLAAAAAESSLTELDVRLAQAERDEARVRRLAAAKAATAEEVEQLSTATAALHAAIQSARVRHQETQRLVDESTLVAPFDGIVTATMLQAGEWASPGAPVLELSGSSTLETEIEVPETVARRLREGQTVDVRLSFADASTTGHVTSIARAAGRPGSLFPVVVSLAANPSLIPGSAVELELTLTGEAALGVPPEAVLNPGSSAPSVFRIRDQRAEKVAVELGQFAGELVTVRADLQAGDRVVVSGHTALANGDQVEVR